MTKKEDWKIKEKVVAILEQNIEKNSRVKHNVQLPVLKSRKGRKRQCDVVITQGKKPRQTISIVEVQKRNSKTDINTFGGWVKKMEEVGAQHLICVSEKGFPASIIEEAELIGPSVRLLTLAQLEKDDWPIPPNHFQEEMIHAVYEKLIGMEYVPIHLMKADPKKPKGRPNPSPFEKVFRTESGKLISVNDLMDYQFFKEKGNLNSLPIQNNITVTVHFKWEEKEGLEFMSDYNGWMKMRELKVHFQLSKKKTEIKWYTSEYKQINFGELMWVLNGKFNIGGKINDIIIPIEKNEQNEYFFGKATVLNDIGAFIEVGKSSLKVEKFEK